MFTQSLFCYRVLILDMQKCDEEYEQVGGGGGADMLPDLPLSKQG